MLEINQTGFRAAYDGFDVSTVAAYDQADRTRLLSDAGIIRNRLKVDAGGEITGEFLMSIGYLPGAHAKECPIHAEILRHRPMWAQNS
ncbi:MAG: hypothetical protein EA404_09635 [Spirochaetaceae bacterium]|nr:MAG: hypothetical protein EA404_09635 [Spirochaetaceae bacterium]